jgi:hypothetical protein
VSLGNFSEATDGTMCPGVDSASKNKYQENSLISWNPKGHFRLVAENLYLLLKALYGLFSFKECYIIKLSNCYYSGSLTSLCVYSLRINAE